MYSCLACKEDALQNTDAFIMHNYLLMALKIVSRIHPANRLRGAAPGFETFVLGHPHLGRNLKSTAILRLVNFAFGVLG